MTRDFALMIKPVGALCNMRCSYCYYLGNEASVRSVMSEETLEALIQNYIASRNGEAVSFVWHGGEPTLAGISFFERAVALQKKYLSVGQVCWNNLQSNGYALNEDWCRFLKENHFDVGISLDGTKMIHDKNRRDVKGNPTYNTVVKKIRLLEKYGIKPDLLCTVNSESVKRPLEVYRTLRDLNTGWIQFIPVVNHIGNGEVSADSVSAEEYGEFLFQIFEKWITEDLGKVNVQLFVELLQHACGYPVSLCTLQDICGNVLAVESDGSVYSCDHFVRKENYLGDVHTPLSEMISGPLQSSFGKRKQEGLPEECRACDFVSFCNGGCLKDRILPDRRYYLCEGMRYFLQGARKYLKRFVKLNENKATQTEIMREMQIIRDEEA